MGEDTHDYLVHYGVLGMKWGVRKDRKTSSRQKVTIQKAAQDISDAKSSDKTVGDVAKFAKTLISENKRQSSAKKVTSEAKKTVKDILSERKENKAKKQAEKAEKQAEKEKKKKGVKGLSDEELKNRIERLEMEKKLKSLEKANLSEGSKLAQDILKDAGKNIGTQLATYGLGTLVNKLLKSDVVNPKKGQKDK